MTVLYAEDLAHVHASGYGAHAAAAIGELLPRLAAAGVRSVVDVGSGAGLTTRALVDAGLSVVAIEPSPAFAELTRAAAPAAAVRCESVYGAALPACDAILAIGEALSYHEPDVDAVARLRGFFAAAAGALRPGGLLAFDLIVTGEPSLAARGWSAGEDWAVLVATTEGGGRLERAIETFRRIPGGEGYRRAREVHHVHLFGEVTLAGWLAEAGFEATVASTYGGHPLAPRRRAFFATRC